jgi:polyisoprenoid-binding protein YceI
MQRSRFFMAFLVAVCVLGAAGCADPADGKTEAVVGEATHAPTEVSGTHYTIAEGSTIGFVGSKVTGSHDGGFNTFSGDITLVGQNPVGSSVSLLIDTTSMWADNDRLTGHLKSGDFFDVESHPEASFESTGIEAADSGFMVTGNLNLHGVTKSISFPADIEVSAEGVKATAEFSIKRFDFEIVYKGKADDLIRDDVVIKFDLKGSPTEG